MTATHVPEVHRGLTGLLVPRGRRLHPIVRLDYLVRVSTYPLYFILFAVTLYPDRYTTFFWVLLSFHLFAVAASGAGHRLAGTQPEARRIHQPDDRLGDHRMLPAARRFNLGPCTAAVLGIFSGCISVGGWRMGVRSALAIAFGVVVAGAMYGVNFQPLGGSVLAQGLGVVVIFVYVTVFSYQSYGQAQRMVKVAKQMEAQSIDLQRNGALLEERTHQLELARDAAEAANSAKSAVPGEHEPRAAHAAQRDHRLQRDAGWRRREDSGAGRCVPDLEKIRSAGQASARR